MRRRILIIHRNPSNLAYLPYIKGVTEKIAKILKKKDITTSFETLQTIKQRMRPIKDPIDHKKGKESTKYPAPVSFATLVKLDVPLTLD